MNRRYVSDVDEDHSHFPVDGRSDRAIKLNPRLSEAYNNRGLSRLTLNDSEGALRDFDLAIKLKPNYAAPYFNRGIIFNAGVNPSQAAANFQKALALDPGLAEAYSRLK
ncbi:MAG: hypothetical protein L0220_15435 [Acidobacteria bacterium]|nr:hypothetical protein [Acidobacteriota bacterium]